MTTASEGVSGALPRESVNLSAEDLVIELRTSRTDLARLVEAAVRDLEPDVVIADIRMPPRRESDGARAAARIRVASPDTGILLLSQHVELRECLDLVGTPGFGYLLKDRVLHLAEFDDALTAAGVEHEIVTYPGAPHSFFDRKHEEFAADSEDAWNRVLAFLARYA